MKWLSFGNFPGCWTGVELIRPNFPTTTVRKTTTVVAVANAVGEAASHMSSGLSAPCSAAAFHVPFIVVTLRRIGRFFFADALFSQCTAPPRANERFMPSTTAAAVATAMKLAGPFA
jgi:hypothetical protein